MYIYIPLFFDSTPAPLMTQLCHTIMKDFDTHDTPPQYLPCFKFIKRYLSIYKSIILHAILPFADIVHHNDGRWMRRSPVKTKSCDHYAFCSECIKDLWIHRYRKTITHLRYADKKITRKKDTTPQKTTVKYVS